MPFYTIEKKNILNLLSSLIQEFTLIAPVKRGNRLLFEEVRDRDKVLLTSRNTDMSPKASLFPQTEVIFAYKEGRIKEEAREAKKRLLFSVRPCDAKGFALLGKVFKEGDFKDTLYQERSKDCIIFGMACNDPRATCLCTSFGLGPFSKEDVDVFFIDLGEGFLLESITEKGDEILSRQDLVRAVKMEIDRAGELEKEAADAIGDRLNVSGLRDKLSRSFDNPVWEEIHQRCVGCGACTFFCPTCHCFDIVDEGDAESGERIRIWDSCMFPLFTLHASGHQPRETGKERFRQRIMHKFNYFPERFNKIACVGCGRCIINCPVNIDIREIFKQLGWE